MFQSQVRDDFLTDSKACIDDLRRGIWVSVPIWGLFFLAIVRAYSGVFTLKQEFPPPSGDYFFNQLYADRLYLSTPEIEFPSPLGNYFFNDIIVQLTDKNAKAGLFPSPLGDYFFNWQPKYII